MAGTEVKRIHNLDDLLKQMAPEDEALFRIGTRDHAIIETESPDGYVFTAVRVVARIQDASTWVCLAAGYMPFGTWDITTFRMQTRSLQWYRLGAENLPMPGESIEGTSWPESRACTGRARLRAELEARAAQDTLDKQRAEAFQELLDEEADLKWAGRLNPKWKEK